MVAQKQSDSLRPLHDRVLVRRIPEAAQVGSIHIPAQAREKPQQGTVVATGPGRNGIPVGVKSGDTVLFGKYAGQDVTVDGGDLLIMRDDEILGILTEAVPV